MTIEVTPRGTRGGGIPRVLRRVLTFMAPMQLSRYRRRGGRLEMNGQPLVLLRTVGAKSGARRETLLQRFPDGDSTSSWIVTATGAGSASHPRWFLNMASHPDQVWVEIAGQPIHVRPETLSGEERDAAWQRIVSLVPSFGAYPTKTDRLFPVLRLTSIP